jgi:hypothetical protein
MLTKLFCFLFASVSKSLLIVLGTLSLPAKNCRGKCRTAGMERSRSAWITRRASGYPHFPPHGYDDYHFARRGACSRLRPDGAGVRAKPRTPACPSRWALSLPLAIFPLRILVSAFLQIVLRRRFALVKALGSLTCNLGIASHAPSSFAQHPEEALTIPVRRAVAENQAENKKYIFRISMQSSFGSAPTVRAGRTNICTANPLVIECPSLIGQSERRKL